MKIRLSKSQWENIGKEKGWIKIAATQNEIEQELYITGKILAFLEDSIEKLNSLTLFGYQFLAERKAIYAAYKAITNYGKQLNQLLPREQPPEKIAIEGSRK